MLHGRKRWFLYPPAAEAVPGFHPNMSSLTWQTQVLPGLVEAGDESAYVDEYAVSCMGMCRVGVRAGGMSLDRRQHASQPTHTSTPTQKQTGCP